MKQEEYRSCMSQHMGGGRLKGLSKEDRKIEFCTIAKQCSKDTPYDEAKRLCAEAVANPKPPKKPKGKKICTLRDLDAITTCVVESIDVSTLTQENRGKVFGDALKKCSGGAPAKQRITSAQASIAQMDPKQMKALESIAILSKQAEGRKW